MFYVVTMLFGFFCGCKAFVIGLSQISSFFSYDTDQEDKAVKKDSVEESDGPRHFVSHDEPAL